MKHMYRHNAPPTPESLTRAALKNLTREEMLAAKFAEETMRVPGSVPKAAPPPPPVKPMTFNLGLLIP